MAALFENDEEKIINAAVDINLLEFIERGNFDNGAKLLYKKLKAKNTYTKTELKKNSLFIYYKWKAKADYYKNKVLEEKQKRKTCGVCLLDVYLNLKDVYNISIRGQGFFLYKNLN